MLSCSAVQAPSDGGLSTPTATAADVWKKDDNGQNMANNSVDAGQNMAHYNVDAGQNMANCNVDAGQNMAPL